MNKLMLACTLITITLLTGCSQRVGDFTLASTKNVNLNNTEFTDGGRVTASDTVPVILFPLGRPSAKEAIDMAIEKNRCAVALNDVVVDYGFFAFIFGAVWMDAEGTLVIDESKPDCQGAGKKSRQAIEIQKAVKTANNDVK